MTFRVEITRTAAREVEERYGRINEQARTSAEKWRTGLIEAVELLSTNPEMYPKAPEAEWYGEGLREFYYGKRRNTYRVLFEIRGMLCSFSVSVTAGKISSSRKSWTRHRSWRNSVCQPLVRPKAAALRSRLVRLHFRPVLRDHVRDSAAGLAFLTAVSTSSMVGSISLCSPLLATTSSFTETVNSPREPLTTST